MTPTNSRQAKKRVGRGGKRGKTSGRGHKGQGQHGSHGMRPDIRDRIKKIPKLPGYRFNSFRKDAIAVNVSLLNTIFEQGDVVNPSTLAEKKVITKRQATNRTIKILGHGDLDKKLTCEGCLVSKTAEEKILKAKGTVV